MDTAQHGAPDFMLSLLCRNVTHYLKASQGPRKCTHSGDEGQIASRHYALGERATKLRVVSVIGVQ